jgi:S-adenosyl methyltransferase
MSHPEQPGRARRARPWDVTDIDLTVPSVARAYDYALGGKDHFEVDRRAVDEILAAFPGARELAWANRRFLRRGVEHLVREAGIRQVIEVGSGLPSPENVHEVAQAVDPAVRVVYADIDPSVVAHVRALLADDSTTAIVADAADPASILDDPVTRRFLDLDEPFAVLMAGVLQHLSDEQDPVGVTRRFRDRMPPGSHLLVCTFLDDDPRAAELERAIIGRFGSGRFRTWETQRLFFEGLELLPPGLVYADDWRPDRRTPQDSAWHTYSCAGIGRKP